MSPPSILIRLEFEASRPIVTFDVDGEGEMARLADWLFEHAALLAIYEQADDLQERTT